MIVPATSWEYEYIIELNIIDIIKDDDIKSIKTNIFYADDDGRVFYVTTQEYQLLVWMGIL